MDLKQTAISICMIVFVLSSMLGIGLGLRVSEIIAPLRNARLVVLSLVANFVVMPFIAIALARILGLEESMGIGLLLLGMAGGAPFLPKLAQISRGNLAFGVGLMVLLMVITVGYLPVVLPMLLPGVSVNPRQIAQSLVLLMLLPLGGALAVNANRPALAARIKPFFDKTSSLSLIALMALQTLLNVRGVVAVFGTGGILAGVVFLAAGGGVGGVLGGPGRGGGSGPGVGPAPRGNGAALGGGRPGAADAIGPGARHRSAEHCRRARRGEPELRRPERGRHGGRHCDRRAVYADAIGPRAWAIRDGGEGRCGQLEAWRSRSVSVR